MHKQHLTKPISKPRLCHQHTSPTSPTRSETRQSPTLEQFADEANLVALHHDLAGAGGSVGRLTDAGAGRHADLTAVRELGRVDAKHWQVQHHRDL